MAFLFFGQVDFVQAKSQVAAKEGILLAAFGTSVPEAKTSFQALEKAFRGKFANTPLVWTYTSQIIRKKLAKQGEMIPGIADALKLLYKQGVRVLRVQPLHLMAGEEYTELERAILLEVKKHPTRFQAVYIGRPLLESREDAEIVGRAVLKSSQAKRGEGTALVLMGHGQEHGRAGLAFEGVRQVFAGLDKMVFMATVEGQRDFDELLAELKAHQVKKVLLQPLMLVAGDHARNDLGGDEDDSWASRLKAQGIAVDLNLQGLGVLPEVAELYMEHAAKSKDDLTKEPKKQ
ncbi:MAG: sirohydrochlorin cobaltochelatase [Desulfovibrio sp.]|nr:sirohydrochlorin cobaltochelatase [Desulfovibrio sp.]